MRCIQLPGILARYVSHDVLASLGTSELQNKHKSCTCFQHGVMSDLSSVFTSIP